MPNFTPNLNLKKPLTTEYYNIADFNDNMDIIDASINNITTNIPKEQYVENESSENTTSTSPIVKVSLTVLEDGQYVIFSHMQASANGGNVELRLNGTSTLSSMRCNLDEGSDPFTAMRIMTLSSGDILSLVYYSSGGATTSVSRARIYIREYKGS